MDSSAEECLRKALLELYEFADAETFPARVLTALQRLLSAEVRSYTEIDLRRRVAIATNDPADLLATGSVSAEENARIFGQYGHENPLIAHYHRTGDPHALRISDFTSRTEFRRLAIYNEFYRQFGLDDQVAVTIRAEGGSVLGVSAARGQRNFSERDKELLTVFRPHLLQAYRNAILVSDLQRTRQISPEHIEQELQSLGLSLRECEVLRVVAQGKTNAKAAADLGVSPLTVKKHLEKIYEKLGVTSRAMAISRLLQMRAGTRLESSPSPQPG